MDKNNTSLKQWDNTLTQTTVPSLWLIKGKQTEGAGVLRNQPIMEKNNPIKQQQQQTSILFHTSAMKRPESSEKVCASVYFLLFIFFSKQRPGAWGNFITAWNIAKASLLRLNGVQWALSCYKNTARHAEVPSLSLWGDWSAGSAAKEMQIGCVRSSLNDKPSSEMGRDTRWSSSALGEKCCTLRCFALNRPTKRCGQRRNASEWWRSALTHSELSHWMPSESEPRGFRVLSLFQTTT